MKRSRGSEWLAVGAILVIMLGIVATTLRIGWQVNRSSSCQDNLKTSVVALLMYSQDYDGTLPRTNWMDSLVPYAKSDRAFHCPSLPPESYGYAFDPRLQGRQVSALVAPAKNVALMETTSLRRNATYAGEPLGERHETKTVLAWADGHVATWPAAKAREAVRGTPEWKESKMGEAKKAAKERSR